MSIKIVDSFLPKKEFNVIKEVIMGDNFPWYYNDRISTGKDPSLFMYFTHNIYREPDIKSNWFHLFQGFLNKLRYKRLLRIKANLHMRQDKIRKNKYHVDYSFKHKGCLFYINENNGYTSFKEDNIQVRPKENRAVFFDPSIKHCSAACSDKKRRININFNYEN